MTRTPTYLSSSLAAWILTLLACCVALPVRAADAPVPTALEEVPYVKTPVNVVDAILSLAGVHAGDRLIDLGSGDGRIVIGAAKRGAQAMGVELDPSLVQLSDELAAKAGVSGSTRFVQQDLFDTDLASATVITMYLLPDVNLALRPRLLAHAPGTRVVSHDWHMGDWKPDASVTLDVPDKPVGLERKSRAHLWVIPARVDGAWNVRLGGAARWQAVRMEVRQRYQEVSVTVTSEGRAPWQGAGKLEGARLTFAVQAGAQALVFDGRVSAGRIEGSFERDATRAPWTADRR